jgi:DNA-binding GntR family transcriptional regulator
VEVKDNYIINEKPLTSDPGIGPASKSLTTVLRARILGGTYPPGTWIREAELQREFGVSNGPVREALQNAVADGLAERAPFRGIRVIELSDREITELFEVRFALLGFAAELAAERTNPLVVESAAALKARIAAGTAGSEGDISGAHLHGDFSHWVFDVAGNPRLAEAYQRPLMQSLLYVMIARKHGAEGDALIPSVHRVIDAIAAGEPSRARRAVRTLTDHTLRYVREAARRNTTATETTT